MNKEQSLERGQRYLRSDGAELRVDIIKADKVYFVSWEPGEEIGWAKQMSLSEFLAALKREKMSLKLAR